MKTIILLLSLVTPAVAQFTPPPSAAYISNGSGGWTPATSTSTSGAVSFTPSPAGIYCFNTSTNQWVPATSACLGGGGGGGGTVTTVSVATANGVSGTVANPATTPAITLSLGAITPTSTNGVSAATMAFMDATSSVQTQLNAKGAGTVTSITTTAPLGGGPITGTGTITCSTCTITIASGQTAIPVTALAANTCDASATTATATGVATTDAPTVAYASDPTGVTGYGGGTSGGISIRSWTTSNTFNFKRCNESGASITPGALNINWKVTR
jgi:hypothetical protein